MAQLLSPICTDALKFQNPFQNLSSGSRLPAARRPWTLVGRSGRRGAGRGRVRVAVEGSDSSESVADDYYSVLGVLPDATPEQIKKGYYNCMKACHPDLSGDNTDTTNFCMFVNDVYAVLSDPVQRKVYDEIQGFALTAINPFLDDTNPKDHVFVDEFSCIGCKNCANVAPNVFAIEEDFGRARAYSQCRDPDLVQQAIDSCPVDCIHWTSAAQLSLLEDEMRRVERVNVALMLSGMGSASFDVFRMASSRWEKRQAKLLAQAKMRMMKQKDADNVRSYWNDLWGKPKDHQDAGVSVKALALACCSASIIVAHYYDYQKFYYHLSFIVAHYYDYRYYHLSSVACRLSPVALSPAEPALHYCVISVLDEEANKRASRAASAARRWREYSRRGADKPPAFKLPETCSYED